MKRWMKIVLPVLLLGLGAGGVALMVVLRPSPTPEPTDDVAPLVRTVVAQATSFRFVVDAQGTVTPRTESDLLPQVSGEVTWVSPALASGGFFEAGEPLIRIDAADYRAMLESARANVARAESEQARAEKEEGRQRRLADRSVASQSRIDDAENALRVANATLRERRAQLGSAERDVERTELRAPYTGRVRQENVDVGQFVSRGQRLARIYAVDFVEVRLPLPDRELAYLDLPRGFRGERPSESAPPNPVVVLEAEFAGRRHQWRGEIVRSEGEIDAKSRMVNVVAQVEDPYGGGAEDDRPPLAVGLFVEARIEGRVLDGAYLLPRTALRREPGEDLARVLVVDPEDRLRFREVEVVREERTRIVIGSGLASGERVCISPLRAVVDGMRVRVATDPGEDVSALVGWVR